MAHAAESGAGEAGSGKRPAAGTASVRRHRAADALRESEHRLRLALECAQMGTWDWNLKSETAVWDKRLFEILGLPYSPDCQAAERFFHLVHPDDAEALRLAAQAAIRERTELHAEFRIVRPDGHVRWLATRGSVSPGREPHMFGVNYDITERKSAEAESHAREERLRLALEAARMATWELNGSTGLIAYSENLEAIVRGKDFARYCAFDTLLNEVHPEDRSPLVTAIDKALSGSAPLEMDYRIKMLDGKYRWIHLKGHGGDGKVLRGISVDIHEQKVMEQHNATLAVLGHKLSAASTPRQAAHLILAAAQDLFGWDAAYLHLYSSTEDKVTPVLTVDLIGGQRREVTPTAQLSEPTPLIRLVVTKGPCLFNGETDAAGLPFTRFGQVERASECMMFVPVRAAGQTAGILSIQSYTRGAYSAEDLKLLESLGDYCGDALQRIKITEALRESERNLRLISENATDVIFAFDMDRRPRYANPAVKDLTGYSFEEIRERGFVNWIHPADQERMLAHWEGLFLGVGYSDVEFRMVTKSGQVKWCSSTWGPLRDETGRQIGVQGRERDITQRRRLELDVLESTTREQLRIGHALHDGVGQVLTGLALKAKTLEGMVSGSDEATTLARQIVKLVNSTIRQTRNLARGLDPVYLGSAGSENFTASLDSLAEQARELLHIQCEFSSPDCEVSLRPELVPPLYHIAQEAILNAAKHAHASKVRLTLAMDGADLRLTIEDDGQGFRLETTEARGMGLRLMRYRADSVGVSLTVDSAPGKGTRVVCRVPGPLESPPIGASPRPKPRSRSKARASRNLKSPTSTPKGIPSGDPTTTRQPEFKCKIPPKSA